MELHVKHRMIGGLVLLLLILALVPLLINRQPAVKKEQISIEAVPPVPTRENINETLDWHNRNSSELNTGPADTRQSLNNDEANVPIDFSGSESPNERTKNPNPPGVNKKDNNLIDTDKNKINTAHLKSKSTSNITTKLNEFPVKTTRVKLRPTPVWILQIGSFTDAKRAATLVKKLRKKGYPVYTQEVNLNHNLTTRVFVGPEAKLEKAQYFSKKLQQEYQIKTIILTYVPQQGRQ